MIAHHGRRPHSDTNRPISAKEHCPDGQAEAAGVAAASTLRPLKNSNEWGERLQAGLDWNLDNVPVPYGPPSEATKLEPLI